MEEEVNEWNKALETSQIAMETMGQTEKWSPDDEKKSSKQGSKGSRGGGIQKL